MFNLLCILLNIIYHSVSYHALFKFFIYFTLIFFNNLLIINLKHLQQNMMLLRVRCPSHLNRGDLPDSPYLC